jgi:hypothetical protein
MTTSTFRSPVRTPAAGPRTPVAAEPVTSPIPVIEPVTTPIPVIGGRPGPEPAWDHRARSAVLLAALVGLVLLAALLLALGVV